MVDTTAFVVLLLFYSLTYAILLNLKQFIFFRYLRSIFTRWRELHHGAEMFYYRPSFSYILFINYPILVQPYV